MIGNDIHLSGPPGTSSMGQKKEVPGMIAKRYNLAGVLFCRVAPFPVSTLPYSIMGKLS